MGYFLADADDVLDEFASIGGYSDFRAWALTQGPELRAFVQRGFSEDLEDLLGELEDLEAIPDKVRSQVDVLRESVARAEEIIIVSDGMSDISLEALGDFEGHPFRGNQWTDAEDAADALLNKPDILKELKIPSVMYHVTTRDKANKILEQGLKPGLDRSSSLGKSRGIYLTDEPGDIGKQGGDITGDTVIEIDTKGLDLRLDPEYFYYDDKSEKSAREYVRAVNAKEELFALYSQKTIPASSVRIRTLGGQGSGNFGHAGRPGEVGGSAPDGSPEANSPEEAQKIIEAEQRKWLTPEEYEKLPPGIRAWKTRTRREKAEGKEPEPKPKKEEKPKVEEKPKEPEVVSGATRAREEAIQARERELNKQGLSWHEAIKKAREEDLAKNGELPANSLIKRTEAINERYDQLRKEAREEFNRKIEAGDKTAKLKDSDDSYRQAKQEDAAKHGPWAYPEEVAAIRESDKNWSPASSLAKIDSAPVEFLPRDTVEAKHLSPKQAIVQKEADKIAQAMGFDSRLVIVRDRKEDPRTFQLNGKTLTEGGHFNPNTGQIEINASYGLDRGVIVHEIQHAQWNYVREQAGEEQQILQRRWAREQAADFAGTRYFLKNGKLAAKYRDEFEKQLPHLSLLARSGMGSKELGIKHDFEALRKDDGVSEYSTKYWVQADEKGGANKDVVTYIGERAIDETLAEVARRRAGHSWSTDTSVLLPTHRFMRLQEDIKKLYNKEPARVKRHFALKQSKRDMWKSLLPNG